MTSTVSSELYDVTYDADNVTTTTAAPSSSSTDGLSAVLAYLAWLIPVIFGIIVVVGVAGNTVVIFVIAKASKRTVTNYYIVNLAVADILFLCFCAPPTAASYAGIGFWFGRFMCKTVFYMQMVTAQATCLLLMAMSVDRFQAIVRPLKSLRTRTLQTAVITSVSIWLFSLLLYIPLLIYFDIKYFNYKGITPFCRELWPSRDWSRGFVIVAFVLVFALPLTIIAACYSVMIRHLWQRVVPNDALSGQAEAANQERSLRQKRKITWMVLTVVLVFTVCWFPIHVLNMWQRLGSSFPYTVHTLNLKTAGHVMSYANSCANPFVYAFLGENFRKSFRQAFACCLPRARRAGPKRDGTRSSRANQTAPQPGGSSGTAGASTAAGGATRVTTVSQPPNDGV